MELELPNNLIEKMFDRKALLWICRTTELESPATSHSEVVSSQNTPDQYRTEPDQDDYAFAHVFWEACWTESIVDRFYDATIHVASSSTISGSPIQARMPYRFPADPDTEGQLDRRRFLPIYEINGTARPGDPEGHFEGSIARRLAHRMTLLRRLESFSGRAIVVVGALEAADLEMLRVAIDFIPTDTSVVILWPSNTPIPDDFSTSTRLDIQFLRASRAEFLQALVNLGVPQSMAVPKLGIRYGKSTLEIREEDLVGIDQDFVLIQASDLELSTVNESSGDKLERLWRSDPQDWTPFASGQVFRRHYRPFLSSSSDLIDFVLGQLQDLANSDRTANVTLTLPATSGSGITTSLRHTAFIAAKSGFPTLICRPTNQRFSVDKTAAFLTRLQEQGKGEHPALIVFDRQQRGIEQVSDLATTLASRGRRAVVVQVISPGGEDFEGPPQRRPRGKHRTAEVFRGAIDQEELRALAGHFSTLYGAADVAVPTWGDWVTYHSKQTMQTPIGERYAESLFWIALRFFVGRRNPDFDLAHWVGRTYEERVTEPEARRAVASVAAYSSFGIAVPLVPLLRSVGTTKMLDTGILPTLREISESEDLLQWGESEEHLNDQTISFKHRLIAIELLSQLGIATWEDRLRACWRVLEDLEASPMADSWLVETLVFEALRVDRSEANANNRLHCILETYDHIPSAIAVRSAPTQHHWARALSNKARSLEDVTAKVSAYSQAIEKLALAVDLAGSERGREHPRNIYTSLGVTRSDLSRVLRGMGQMERAETLWHAAAGAFEAALRFGSDNFVVLSAFANRLIEHAKESSTASEALDDIASALSYLAQAEDSLSPDESLSEIDAQYIHRERYNAWHVIDPVEAERQIDKLIHDGNEIGFVLRAYRMLEGVTNEDWRRGTKSELTHAHDILEEAYSTSAGSRTWRLVALLYRVMSALQTRHYDFQRRLVLLNELDGLAFRWHSGLRFAQAVLCYQSGDFNRGVELFRSLRSGLISGELQPMRLSSFWRDTENPSEPRQATIRIQRIESDWVAYGNVPEMNGQRVLARPRWFEVQPRVGDVRQCHIVFETFGPVAVPVGRRLVSLID